MPIKGIIRAIFPGDRIKNMQVGVVRHLDVQDIILTKDALFIDVDSEIFLDDEIIDDSYVSVKRIGEGLTSSDFELDFTGLDENTFFDIENDAMHICFLSEANRFIIFKKVDYLEIVNSNKETHSVLEEKQLELQRALDNDEFEKASTIRDEIKRMTNEKKQSSRKGKKDRD